MSNIIQVTNIAATVTEDNIKTLFSFIGPIREMIIYFENSTQEETKVAYIVFESNSDAETSLHLHNSVFHDRALIVLPLADSCKGQIPDVSYATMVRAPEKTVTGITPKTKNWPSEVLSMVVGRTGEQSIVTIEPNFTKQELPNYPNLPYSTEVAKIDEIRRTVLVTNLESGTSPQQVLDFFQPVAEVKFIRMAGSEHDNAAYVEFTEQGSVSKAFGMMGSKMGTRPVMIQHSNVAINKPSTNHRSNEEVGSRRIRGSASRSRSKKRSRSRRGSRSRRRSGSRSKKRSRSKKSSRRKSRSRKGTPSRSTHESKPRSSRRSRSRSHHGSKIRSAPKRSRSRHRHDHRSKEAETKTRDRVKKSTSRDKKNRERSRSKHRHHRDKKESRSRHSSKERRVKKEHRTEEEKTSGKEKRHRGDRDHRSAKEDKTTSRSNDDSSNAVTVKVEQTTAAEGTTNGTKHHRSREAHKSSSAEPDKIDRAEESVNDEREGAGAAAAVNHSDDA